MHRDIQRAELKAAEEARHKVTVDLKERQLKVEKLRKKYSTIQGRLSNSEETAEGEKSQAYFIIAAAQEREALQKEGDELNREMRKTEKEIMLLERTLNHLMCAIKNLGTVCKKPTSEARRQLCTNSLKSNIETWLTICSSKRIICERLLPTLKIDIAYSQI